MGGRSSKRKGDRIEREIVNKHLAAGIPSWKVPLSGAIGGSLAGDVRVGPQGLDQLRGEAKGRANGAGFVTIKRWLKDMDLLFLREDHCDPLVVMPWSVYLDFCEARYGTDE